MKIKHPAVASDVFRLADTLEFDLEIGEEFIPTRLELFEDTERKNHWRARMWEREAYHLESTFISEPVAKGKRKTQRCAFDEEILVERTWELSSELEDFVAPTARAALKLVLDRLVEHLHRIAD